MIARAYIITVERSERRFAPTHRRELLFDRNPPGRTKAWCSSSSEVCLVSRQVRAEAES